MADFEPRNAKMWQRAFAFLLDLALVTVISVLINGKFLLNNKFPDEINEFKSYIQSIQVAEDQGKLLTPNSPEEPALQMTPSMQAMFAYIVNMTIIIFWVYFAVNGMLFKGSSIGKRVFKLAVVDAFAFMPIGFFQNIVRSGMKAAMLLYFFPILFLVNYVLPLFNKGKMAGHDYLARTRVVDETEALLAYQEKNREEDEEPEEADEEDEF